MKIVTILGSPRKKGNTEALLSALETSIAGEHTVVRFNIPVRAVNGCIGCAACQKNHNEPGCVINDEISTIIDAICQADCVVYTSPLYVWSFSSQIKALLDRHCCLAKWINDKKVSLIKNKPVLFLSTCYENAESDGDLILEIFKREMNYLDCQVAGYYVAGDCTGKGELQPKDVAEARKLGAVINSLAL